jgi:hypothetical protein
MIVDIEMLVLCGIIFIFCVWLVWFKLSKFINERRYKPENDKGKKCEGGTKFRREFEGTIRNCDNEYKSVAGFEQPEGRSILPTTTSNDSGTTSTSVGKHSKLHKLFRRR